jgi:hypothetical protein
MAKTHRDKSREIDRQHIEDAVVVGSTVRVSLGSCPNQKDRLGQRAVETRQTNAQFARRAVQLHGVIAAIVVEIVNLQETTSPSDG